MYGIENYVVFILSGILLNITPGSLFRLSFVDPIVFAVEDFLFRSAAQS